QSVQRFLAGAFAAFILIAAQPVLARSYASIIIEQETGKVLHAVNPDLRAYPASLTKMMTLYLLFEALDKGEMKLDQKLPVSRRAQRRAPSRLGLKRGQKISVRDVIGALVTKSANDAATVLAEAMGGTEEAFARTMTKKAHALGMTRTIFRNASGLPNRRQRSTARDMSVLAVALARDYPQYYHHFSTAFFRYKGRKYRNHNRLLSRYSGTDGIKTGYTGASGYNLVVSVERNGRRLIGVVFGGKSSRWRDRHMTQLLTRSYKALADEPLVAGAAKSRRIAKASPAKKRKVRKRSRNRKSRTVTAVPRKKPKRAKKWSVQIGVFKRYAPAHLAATRAARAVPSLLRSPVAIVRDEGDSGDNFRARIIGMTEVQARKACRKLKKKKIDCLVIGK
ncbi:MAG: D-alanyl-D-alanine carboxypeptidase family protein, partial [Alphaproteobacteria bacterium]